MSATDKLQLFDSLPAHIEDALRESIRRFGVLVPVVRDQTGRTLDGHHRSRIADEEGATYRVDIVTVADDAEAREIARTLNADRRHLSAEQRQEVVRALREKGHSIPAIAGALGIGQGTAQRDAATLPVGKVPDRSIGTDGVSRPSKRPTIVAATSAKEAERATEWLPLLTDAPDVADATTIARLGREARRQAARDANESAVEGVAPLPTDRFSCIVMDPPWDWGDEGDVDQFGRGRPTYSTMPLEEVAVLPVGELADDNCHLYLWITNRSLPKGFDLLAGWGFRYVTALTWCKPSIGMGNYFRNNTEHVLFGVKGSLPLLYQDTGTWFEAPRAGKHSSKPPQFYQMVTRLSPGPRLEMFARSPREGFTVWGAEAA